MPLRGKKARLMKKRMKSDVQSESADESTNEFEVESAESADESRMDPDYTFADESVDECLLHPDSNHVISSKSLISTFKSLHSCCVDDNDCLVLYEVDKRQGHFRCLKVKCTRCALDVYVDEEPHKEAVHYREHTLDNRRFAFASSCVGLDFNQLSLMCSILNIPGPPDSFDTVHLETIHKKLENVIQEKLEQNRREAKEAHRTSMNEEVTSIVVKSDGTYQKRGDRARGYTSKVAVVLITDALSDKVLDFEVLTKFCHKCNYYRNVLSVEEFNTWYTEHETECTKNFEGASSEMERCAVKKMFGRSVSYGLRYEYLVGDGDSKSFLDIWDCYGVCEFCQKYSAILTKRNTEIYDEWKNTEGYKEWCEYHANPSNVCHSVKKIDCIQHVAKCFRTKLEGLVKVGSKAPDGKSLYRGANRLGPNTRICLQKYFSSAVRSNIRPGILSDDEMNEAVQAMRNAILASLFHTVMLDDAEKRHQYCPLDSWCMYKRGLPMEEKPHYLDSCFLDFLYPIYEYYTQTQMLQRMVAGMTTNHLESFNSTLWYILPKMKFHGQTRVQTAVMLAIITNQDGKEGLKDVMDRLEIPVSDVSYFKSADRCRSKRKDVYRKASTQRFTDRVKDATDRLKNLERQSYSPGILDAGAGPSGEIASTAFTEPAVEQRTYSKNQFVAIAYGPSWFPCRVEDYHIKSNEIQVEALYTHNEYKTFYYKDEDDPGYEGLFWESVTKILCCLPPPELTARQQLTFPTDAIDRVKSEFSKTRARKRTPRT